MRLHFIMALVLLASLSAFGQPGARRFERGGPGPSSMAPGDFAFIRGEFGIASNPVQGAPYTAQAVTRFSRTLADGNRIQRTTTASVARDGEGRTRMERTLDAIGPLAARSGSRFRTVFVNDPVAGVSYILDPNNRVARQMPAFRGPRGRSGADAAGNPAELSKRANRAAGDERSETAPKTEDLGVQTMQGIAVQGKRIARTIPAGEAGNQRAIEIVTETWYSQELQVMLMFKTTDPRFGETIYQLTNISRAEPDRSLFAVPPDYTVQSGPPGRGAGQ